MIWTRQRQTNQLRSMLREFYPAALAAFGEDLAGRDALAVLAIAPTPAAGRALTRSRVVGVLRKAGRQRNLETPSRADPRPRCAPSSSSLSAGTHRGLRRSVRSLVAVITTMVEQVRGLEAEVEPVFWPAPGR